MVHQINPGLSRIYLKHNSRQYGVRHPIVIDNLSEPEQRVMDVLEIGISNNQLSNLAKISKVDETTVASLLARTTGLVRQSGSLYEQLSESEIQSKFSEILRLYASTTLDPSEVFGKRSKAVVFIERLDRFGCLVTKSLAQLGFKEFVTTDHQRVSQADLSPLSYFDSDLGLARAKAVKNLLGDSVHISQPARISSGKLIAFGVVSATDIIRPSQYQPLISRDVTHVGVTFHEAGVDISAVVQPGQTPCLGCFENAVSQGNPQWLETVIQLSSIDRDLADTRTLLVAAAFTIEAITQLVDEGTVKAEGVNFFSQDSTVKASRWPSVDCGCTQIATKGDGPLSEE